MSEVIKYGMVGGGPDAFIGEAHRRSIRLDGKAELVAGCFSRTIEKTKNLGEELGISADRCYENYIEMARKEAERPDGIDFVVVVTPNKTHFEICRAFLEVGINISCDKPVTVNLQQALELERLAKEKDLLFMVTYTYMGYVSAKHVREIIRKGEIGVIRTVMAEYPQGWLADENNGGGKQGAWRCDPAQSGNTNALGDIGTHIENIVSSMTGLAITRVLAKMETVVCGRVLDDNDFVLVEYENGASGMYWCSQLAIGCDNSLKVRIFGSKGTVEWFQETPDTIKIFKMDGSANTIQRGYSSIEPAAAKYTRLPSGHSEGWFAALGNLYCSFISCIEAKKKGGFADDMIDFPTIAAGIDGIRYIEACLKSSRNGNIWTDI